MDREKNKKIIVQWCENIVKDNNEIYYGFNKGKKYTRFIKKDITNIIFRNNGLKGSYGEHKIIYEIQNEINNIEINCVIGSKGLTNDEKEQCNKIIEKLVDRRIKENWKYVILKSWSVYKESKNNLENIEEYITEKLTLILEKEIPIVEREILSIMGNNKDYIEEDGIEIEEYEFEGKRSLHYIEKYERSSKNRENAIKIHGLKCICCGFDFEEVYGELGKNFIEVHHKKPVCNLEEEQLINPRTDLVCLCSNCHSMIHRNRQKIISVEKLKESIIAKKKAKV